MFDLFLQVLIMPEYLIPPVLDLFFYSIKALDLKVELAFLGHSLDLVAEEVLSCLVLDDMGGFGPYSGQSLR
jgi:hypothetical protein